MRGQRKKQNQLLPTKNNIKVKNEITIISMKTIFINQIKPMLLTQVYYTIGNNPILHTKIFKNY